MITAILQVFIVWYTQSVALLADTVHNFTDAFTSIPLWLAFIIGRRKNNSRFTYGYGRAEDLAGLLILVIIGASAVLVFLESIMRFYHPSSPEHLSVLTLAGIIGFMGNEAVAQYRIKIGKKIGSEALIADGLHSRTDGFVSLSVVVGAIGSYFGYAILDPIIGIIIGFMILWILKEATPKIINRLMDSIDPKIIEEIAHEIGYIPEVAKVVDVKARWIGRSIFTDIKIIVNRDLTIIESYNIEKLVEAKLNQKFPVISQIYIEVIPCNHHLKMNCN